MTLQERIAELMEAMNWSHSDLVRVSRQSSSVISQWRGVGNGKIIQSIGSVEGAVRLERESGFSAIWIANGTLPKKVPTVWPFPRLQPDQWPLVPPNLRKAAEDMLLGALPDAGAANETTPPPPRDKPPSSHFEIAGGGQREIVLHASPSRIHQEAADKQVHLTGAAVDKSLKSRRRAKIDGRKKELAEKETATRA